MGFDDLIDGFSSVMDGPKSGQHVSGGRSTLLQEAAPHQHDLDDLFQDGPSKKVPQSQKCVPEQDTFDSFFQSTSPSVEAKPVAVVDMDILFPSEAGRSGNASTRQAKPADRSESTFLDHFLQSAKGVDPSSKAHNNTLRNLQEQTGHHGLDAAQLGVAFQRLLTPFEILGVDPNASVDTIRSVYKKKALRWHPDRNHDLSPADLARFQQMTQAYEVLMDDEQRNEWIRKVNQK